MSQSLIEQNGKYYKEVEVVMLPATETNQITFVKHTQGKNIGKLQIPIAGGEYRRLLSYDFEPQHLYFLSDEEIKEGDWCINDLNVLVQVTYKNGASVNNVKKHCKKIIATTDKWLGTNNGMQGASALFNNYPQPSPEFIQAYIDAYNQGKPIIKCLVEYELPKTISISKHLILTGSSEEKEEINSQATLKLKDNQIIIKKIEEKVYSESQIRKAFQLGVQHGHSMGYKGLDHEDTVIKSLK